MASQRLHRGCFTAMVTRVVGAKIACLDFGLMKAKMKLGVQILLETPDKLDGIRQRYVCREVLLSY